MEKGSISPPSLLSGIWHSQDHFNTLMHGRSFKEFTPAEINHWMDKYGILLVRELAEFIAEFNTKPHRKETKTFIRSNALEEWIDVFKYWLCLGRLNGFTEEEFLQEYYRKTEVVAQRFFQEKQLQYTPGNIVGVDIDGVLADYPVSFVNFINQELGTDFKRETVKEYNISECFGLPLEVVHELKHKYRETGQKRFIPVVPGAKEMLQSIKDAGYTIVLLTARPYKQYKRIFADTQEWLHINELPYDSIIWDENKNERLVREFGYDKVSLFVEDVASNANSIAKLGIKCFLLTCPYNQDIVLEPSVERVDSLERVIEYVRLNCKTG